MLIVTRKGYKRRDGTRVSPTTFAIKNRGLPGRGPKLFTLRKGGLTEFGYRVKDPLQIRHVALSRAISQGVPSLTLSRRLGALATLLKRTSPQSSRRLRSNQKSIIRM